MKKLKPRTVRRAIVISALLVALATLAIRGFLLPWSEEGVLFALYGGGVGFALAILLHMALVYFFRDDRL